MKRTFLCILGILFCTCISEAQNKTKRVFRDAAFYGFKGHVKECVEKTCTQTEKVKVVDAFDALQHLYDGLLDGESEFVYKFKPSGLCENLIDDKTIKRDKLGRIIFRSREASDGFVMGVRKSHYKYNNMGIIAEEYGTEPFDMSTREFKNIYTYDNEGNIIEYRMTSEYSQDTVEKYQVIEKDKMGNWIKCISQSGNSKTIYTRKITYY